MTSLKFVAALAAAGLFTSGMVFAEGAKPNDAQIAHIAYTAGQLDIEAAEQASRKAKIRTFSLSQPIWSEITKR
jgi:putative membrane protein